MRTFFKTTFFILLFLPKLISAQDFSGQATYESKNNSNTFKITSANMSDAEKEEIEKKILKMSQKTFILNFNAFESEFFEEIQLADPMSGKTTNTIRSTLYKNIKNKTFVEERDFMDKSFLVIDSLKKLNWTITNESKVIGNYNCIKATIITPVTEEEKQAYEKKLKKQKEGKTQFIALTEPKENVVVAWFTMEIPVSNGPIDYWGLPGLILEINNGYKSYLCSKIILNPKEKNEIKLPKRGKTVSEKEYDDLVDKKMKEFTNKDGVIEIRSQN